MTPLLDFIVIDDDPINNLICQKTIELTVRDAVVQTFTDPEKALANMLLTYAGQEAKNVFLLLDINMPRLSGWEVLERFNDFPDLVNEHIKIYMLSSSVDPKDQERAGNNPLVSGFISKPLTQDKLTGMVINRHNV